MALLSFDKSTEENVSLWLNGDYDTATKQEIRDLLKNNPEKIIDSFYTSLSFGTGGVRAKMGPGTNRINRYTVRGAIQGLANYINKQKKSEKKPVVLIGYDCRKDSRIFAEEAAKVLAANSIGVILFTEIHPSPLVSFGCRYKKCSAAIMITASHNPPEYNGLKIYWNDGGQVLPPHDHGIIKEVHKISTLSQIKILPDLASPLIEWTDQEIDQAYFTQIKKYSLNEEDNRKFGNTLKIVYTPLHGTGSAIIPKALQLWGFYKTIPVAAQMSPDPDFPTVKVPNPEEKASLDLGIKTLEEEKGDILLATDPDSDRIGVVVKHQGKPHFLTGNQTACICLQYLCRKMKEKNLMPKEAAFVKTIATSELFRKISEKHKRVCVDVLPGFKYVAEKIREWEQEPRAFIFGAEESYGMLFGTHARDKDAIVASCLIAEAALHAKLFGKTLVDRLYELYREHGIFFEKQFCILFKESHESEKKMAQGLETLQKKTFKKILGVEVCEYEDYAAGVKMNWITGKKELLTLPRAKLFLYRLADGTKLILRPSGTEPKIKIYCGIVKNCENIPQGLKEAEEKADMFLDELKKFF